MPVLDRHVRRLHLTATHEDHVRHGRVLLEDALRTASLGDETRLIIVRRLDLGHVSSRATSTHWSRRIEESFRQSTPVPVSIHHASADRATAVYFASRLEPWLQLATRTIARQPCTGWFWQPALPGWKQTMPYRQTLALCFTRLIALGGLGATLTLARRLGSTDAIVELAQQLSPSDLTPLQAELGFLNHLPPTQAAASVASEFSNAVHPSLTPAGQAFIKAIGPEDIRTWWLATALLDQQHSAQTALTLLNPSPLLIQSIARIWQEEISTRTEPPSTASPTLISTPNPARHLTPPAQADEPLRPTQNAPEPPPDRAAHDTAERQFTRAAGLFFLVPLFNRIRLPVFLETLDDEDQAAFPWQLLRLALRHARTPDNDPLVLALDALPPARSPLGRWLIAANRETIKLTGLNLRRLIRRTAALEITSTHIDLFFRAGDAEIGLRRAGLDLDPGWIPWLSRIIHFHFNRED